MCGAAYRQGSYLCDACGTCASLGELGHTHRLTCNHYFLPSSRCVLPRRDWWLLCMSAQLLIVGCVHGSRRRFRRNCRPPRRSLRVPRSPRQKLWRHHTRNGGKCQQSCCVGSHDNPRRCTGCGGHVVIIAAVHLEAVQLGECGARGHVKSAQLTQPCSSSSAYSA